MKATTVKYTRHFRETDEWVGVEGVPDEGEDYVTAAKKAKQMVDDAYATFRATISHTNTEAEPVVGVTAETILSCNDTTTLKVYGRLVGLKGYEHLQPVYNRRMDELLKSHEDKL